MKKNLLPLFQFLFIASVMLSCKTEEPAASKLKIISPAGIIEQVLNSETSYTFGINNCAYNSIIFNASLIKKDGTLFNIATSTNSSLIVQYKPDTVSDALWVRGGKDNTYVKGLITCNTFINNSVKDTAYYEFYVPLKPNKPQINLINVATTTEGMTANIGFSSVGATSYKVNYIAYGEELSNSVSVIDKEQVACTLPILNPAKRFSVYVQAINSCGFTTSDTVTIGSTYTTASCVLNKTATDAKYQIKVGETIFDNFVIKSAGIYDTNGTLLMSVPTVVNQYFSIASLPAGVYLLKVIVKDYGQCGKTFLK